MGHVLSILPCSSSQRFQYPLIALHSPSRPRAVGHIGEVLGQVVGGDAPESEEFYAGGVDDGAAEVEGVSAGGGGGVDAFVGVAADEGGAELEMGLDGVDEGAFADAAVAGEDRFAVAEEIAEFVEADVGGGAGLPDGRAQ